jgi:hypothetical protein
MQDKYASGRRRYHLASRWCFYSKMLRDKMFLIGIVGTHHRTRDAPEVRACLAGKNCRGGVRPLTVTIR